MSENLIGVWILFVMVVVLGGILLLIMKLRSESSLKKKLGIFTIIITVGALCIAVKYTIDTYSHQSLIKELES